MTNRYNITKFLKLIFYVCFLLVLSACSSSDDSAEKTETVMEIPQSIQKLALNTIDPNTELLAWITIDGGTRTQLTIDLIAGTAGKSITLSRSMHTVLIEFEFTDGTDTITLASATKTVDLTAGNASLSFADADYITANYDKDSDGLSNLDEIRNGTDPLVASTKILDSLSVTPGSVSITLGLTQTLTVTATYKDNSTANVTSSVSWSSSNNTIATVSTNGIITSVALGNATITASLSGQSASSVITVIDKVLTGLSVKPASTSITLGQTQALSATATYTDNSTAIVTSSVSWSSNNNDVATVAANGIVTSVALGNVTITASLSEKTASSVITVIDTPITDCVLGTSKIGECKL